MSKAYQRFLEAKFLMYEIEGEPPEVIKEIQESMRDALLEHIKTKWEWTTVPLILEKRTDDEKVKFIGGFTDLQKYLEIE